MCEDSAKEVDQEVSSINPKDIRGMPLLDSPLPAQHPPNWVATSTKEYLESWGITDASQITIMEAEQYLDRKEKELTLLEKASQLQKRFWRYEKPDVARVWATRWIATPIVYLFPRDRREEWLGDLYQENMELLNQGYSRWLINLINVWNTIILVASALSIKVSDLVSLALQRQK